MKTWLKDAGNIRNVILLGILLLVGAKRIVEIYQHPPQAEDAFAAMEQEQQGMWREVAVLKEHNAHADTLAWFALCRESKSATKSERVSVGECLERYPSMLDLGIAELNAMERDE